MLSRSGCRAGRGGDACVVGVAAGGEEGAGFGDFRGER